MQLTKSFWITIIVMSTLFFVPYLLTRNAPSYDGSAVFGFPIPFYSWGGLCPSSDGFGGICKSFSVVYLLIDVAFLIGSPFVVNFISLRLNKD